MLQASNSPSEIQSLSTLRFHHHQPVASQATKSISAEATGHNPVPWPHLTVREVEKCNLSLCKRRINGLGEPLHCFCHQNVPFSKNEPISYVNLWRMYPEERRGGGYQLLEMEDKNSVLITSLTGACLKHNFQLSNV